MNGQLGDGRLVVVSPHLDDAIMSVGAAVAEAAQGGGTNVLVLTIFAGDVDSNAPASRWDQLAGFATEGEAVLARREEDASACAIVEAEARWLPFADWPYSNGRDEERILEAVSGVLEPLDTVLVPGFPLAHPDHRFVCEQILRAGIPCRALGLYAEQPYRHRLRLSQPEPLLASDLAAMVGREPLWEGVAVTPGSRRKKLLAIEEYRSQLGPLELEPEGMLEHEVSLGGESIAWVR